MLSARSQGLPAIAVPGDDAWEPAWAQLLSGRRVSIVFDCDPPGRHAARRIAGDLHAAGVTADVDPLRIHASCGDVRMPELPLDDRQRHAFACELDSMRMPQLMRREPAPNAGRCGVAAQLAARGGR